MLSTGVTLGDLRIPLKGKFSNVKAYVDSQYLEAIPVTNKKILDIRQNHSILLNGKPEVRRLMKAKEEDAARKEKKEKIVPSVKIPESMLPNRYIRGELPCTIEHGAVKYLSWACPLENLDYEYYLPLFFDGLQCDDMIVGFIARQGIEDMLYASRGSPERIKSVIPSLVRPLRNALSKFDTNILLSVLKALEQLITCNDGIGEVLMSYGKQFLGPISFFMDEKKNIGDQMDFAQRRNNDIGEEIRKVLELMEVHGGPKALQQIKFSIPLYQSCVKRPDAHHLKS
mmetsp:Transcript_27441/g.37832  ORF Transcript_27441/g.37832 Transcript_27441/m.37832 type:complete len:285 (-) Transcript_27441:103-957(-)|eukprot:CAMPEP_0170118754 /NCGR_PEP_ID=MMETSP0020_2-20130122/13936_1 /TAXON_ID=98059 /ORGANISM="Dinobryon sp., Strain UTEXLB2267" /LENGTH=284 /DNA_ID=CAMNT_0010347889 /DNA_START=195 /DNA_END=1049 /DNA_ORIENTATION=-